MTIRSIQDRVLTAMWPGHQAPPPPRWQQKKSEKMRSRLIEAAVGCLVEYGYGGLTTAAVAERCRVSRGAMHHHFPTRLDLVAAVVEHVFYQRMRSFLDDYFVALRIRGEDRMIEVACDIHWESVHTREYAAYVELAVAARTDTELERHFVPAAQRFDEIWTSEMIEAFPKLRAQWEAMKLANDFAIAVHVGMLLQEPVFGRGERMARLQTLVGSVIRSLYVEE